MSKKYGYFQGTEEPAPKKQKYKPEKAIVVQPRFKEPFYHNYDYGKSTTGPGQGLYSNLNKYKSVSDFIKEKRKENSDKYKADDLWIEDSGKNKKKQSDYRLYMLYSIIKEAIDYPIDDQINPIIPSEESGAYIDSVPFSYSDKYLSTDDFEGKSVDQLDFGRDYVNDEHADPKLKNLENKYLNPEQPSLYGLPDGIDPVSDLDPEATMSPYSQQYGETNSGNTLYDKISF
jgi:hypothetical protein